MSDDPNDVLITPRELSEIVATGQEDYKKKDSEYTYANMYVTKKTYYEWKALCDAKGINYGPRVTVLMKDDIKKLKKL